MSVLFARRPPQRAFTPSEQVDHILLLSVQMRRALTPLKRCRSAVKRGKAESGPTLAALCEVLLEWGLLGSVQYAEGWKEPGKRAAALQNH